MKRTIYDEDHEAFRASVKEFLDRQVVPDLERHAAEKAIPREFWIEAASRDSSAWRSRDVRRLRSGRLPLQRGAHRGAGQGQHGAALRVGIHADIVAPYLVHLTTDEQKKRWLPGFCSGELLTAIGMTEPSGGSTSRRSRPPLLRDGDYWVLNGSKTFITNGYSADLSSSPRARRRRRRPAASRCSASRPTARASAAAASSTRSGRTSPTPPSSSSTTCASPTTTSSASSTTGSST